MGDLLTDLALSSSEFRKAIFNPDEGTINEQIDIVLNQSLLHFPPEMNTKLSDGDVITLFPMISGG